MTRQTATAEKPTPRAQPDAPVSGHSRYSTLTSIGLLALSAILASAAFAPFGQFYLAWVALVPWLAVVAKARSMRSAFVVGAAGGFLFYIITLSWLWRATIPGTIGVSCYLAIFWGFAAMVIHSARLVKAESLITSRRIAMAAALVGIVWASNEWLRSWVLGGFPWAFISQTQTPILPMCQIADITGGYGITFWIVLVYATVYFAIVARRRALLSAALSVAVVACFGAYGFVRIAQTQVRPGPRVMVVQPNHPHERGGAKTVTQEQQIEFHVGTTREALRFERADLVVWSETVMPGLNPEARNEPGLAGAAFLQQTHDRLSRLAAEHGTALLTGAYYIGGWQGELGKRRATDIRNSAFFYDRTGAQSEKRYDKIHLVPFAEFLPFRESAPRIYAVLRWFAAYSVDYPIVAGDSSALTVFSLDTGDSSAPRAFRFVTPICFEDNDSALVASMFRPASWSEPKRADFIVNITNDGWFRGIEQPQHLQSAILRSIENRAPTARADNTGISGFIDSCGRTIGLIPVKTSGTSTLSLPLDDRTTVYSRVGDVFGVGCTLLTLLLLIQGIIRR